MKKLLIVSLVLIGAFASAAPAGASTQYMVKETTTTGQVTYWGDWNGSGSPNVPGTPMTQARADRLASNVRALHRGSIADVLVYDGRVLRAWVGTR